jgi:hypothetical protein
VDLRPDLVLDEVLVELQPVAGHIGERLARLPHEPNNVEVVAITAVGALPQRCDATFERGFVESVIVTRGQLSSPGDELPESTHL